MDGEDKHYVAFGTLLSTERLVAPIEPLAAVTRRHSWREWRHIGGSDRDLQRPRPLWDDVYGYNRLSEHFPYQKKITSRECFLVAAAMALLAL